MIKDNKETVCGHDRWQWGGSVAVREDNLGQSLMVMEGDRKTSGVAGKG